MPGSRPPYTAERSSPQPQAMNENREQSESNGGNAGGDRLNPMHFTITMMDSKKQAK